MKQQCYGIFGIIYLLIFFGANSGEDILLWCFNNQNQSNKIHEACIILLVFCFQIVKEKRTWE